MLLGGFSAHSLSRIKIEWAATLKTQACKYISTYFHFYGHWTDGRNSSVPSLETSGETHIEKLSHTVITMHKPGQAENIRKRDFWFNSLICHKHGCSCDSPEAAAFQRGIPGFGTRAHLSEASARSMSLPQLRYHYCFPWWLWVSTICSGHTHGQSCLPASTHHPAWEHSDGSWLILSTSKYS